MKGRWKTPHWVLHQPKSPVLIWLNPRILSTATTWLFSGDSRLQANKLPVSYPSGALKSSYLFLSAPAKTSFTSSQIPNSLRNTYTAYDQFSNLRRKNIFCITKMVLLFSFFQDFLLSLPQKLGPLGKKLYFGILVEKAINPVNYGWMDGWMEGRTDGRVDGQADRQTDR